MKIASLIPSGTDIACALGLAENLVGVSHACDHPTAQNLPILTRSVVPAELAPAEIDVCVANAVASGESLYQTDREWLEKLAPDLVLTQSICDVCAVNSQTAAQNLPANAQLLNLSATSLAGLWADLRAVALAADVSAEPLIQDLQARLKTVEKSVENRPKPRVLVLEWSEPPFLGGHWVPEMVEIAGGIHVLSEAGQASRRANWQEIAEAEPEIIVLAPCGYGLEETVSQGRELFKNPEFAILSAARHGAVWATDATALFSRCTPATVRGIEVLAGIFQAEVCAAPRADEARICDLS